MKKQINQKDLFHKIKAMQFSIVELAGYLQNDFDKLLEDDLIDKETIKNEIIKMNQDYHNVITKLNELKGQANLLMLSYV
jgi:hypothetical protein